MGGFLADGRVRGRDGVEIQRLEKLELFSRRHQRVLHELIQGFKALDVDAHSILVAVAGTIKGILFGKAKPSQIAHSRFKPNIIGILPLPLLAAFGACFAVAQGDMTLAIEMLYLATAVGGAGQMRWIVIAQYRQSLLELVLLDVAVGSQVTAGGTPRDKVFAGQKGQGARVVVIGEMHLGQPESIRITVYSIEFN